MTSPVQNVKFMQSTYRKYQIFAIICAVLTVFASFLAALSGIRLNSLRKAQAKELENSTLMESQLNADAQKELKEIRLFLKSSQQQLNEEKEKVERLQQLMTGLERQLAAAQAKANAKADSIPPAPRTEKSPAVQTAPKTNVQPTQTPKSNPDASPGTAVQPPSEGSKDQTDNNPPLKDTPAPTPAASPAPQSEGSGALDPKSDAKNSQTPPKSN
jgi:septal ring factor EnvC (AmiA/AmiB activator)